MKPASWRNVAIDPDTGRIRLPRRYAQVGLKPRPARAHGGLWRSVAINPATGQLLRGSLTIEPGGSLEIRLPQRLESPNALLHAHWRERHDDKKAWAGLLLSTINGDVGRPVLEALGFLTIRDRRRLAIERRVSTVRHLIRDRENLMYSVKFLVDRIRDVGLIRDDSMKWIDLEVSQAVSPDGCDWTVIRIELPADGVLQPLPPLKGRKHGATV